MYLLTCILARSRRFLPPAPYHLVRQYSHRHIALYTNLARQAWIAERSRRLVVPVLRRRFAHFHPHATRRTDATPAAVGAARQPRVWREAVRQQDAPQVRALFYIKRRALIINEDSELRDWSYHTIKIEIQRRKGNRDPRGLLIKTRRVLKSAYL
jgi:hypothetical protein